MKEGEKNEKEKILVNAVDSCNEWNTTYGM